MKISLKNTKLSLEADSRLGVDDIPPKDETIYGIKRALLVTIFEKKQ